VISWGSPREAITSSVVVVRGGRYYITPHPDPGEQINLGYGNQFDWDGIRQRVKNFYLSSGFPLGVPWGGSFK